MRRLTTILTLLFTLYTGCKTVDEVKPIEKKPVVEESLENKIRESDSLVTKEEIKKYGKYFLVFVMNKQGEFEKKHYNIKNLDELVIEKGKRYVFTPNRAHIFQDFKVYNPAPKEILKDSLVDIATFMVYEEKGFTPEVVHKSQIKSLLQFHIYALSNFEKRKKEKPHINAYSLVCGSTQKGNKLIFFYSTIFYYEHIKKEQKIKKPDKIKHITS
ncbi:hypothetical protein KY332_04465 [Candidatus Woesearchaeota archaeon]|nr:hypothetical protein [Candidatus Woesearchaeota archaeon]